MSEESIIVEGEEATVNEQAKSAPDPRLEAIERLSDSRAAEFEAAPEPEPEPEPIAAKEPDPEPELDATPEIESEALKALTQDPEEPNEIEQLKAELAALKEQLVTAAPKQTEPQQDEPPVFNTEEWLAKVREAEEDGDYDLRIELENQRFEYERQLRERELSELRQQLQTLPVDMAVRQFHATYPEISKDSRLLAAADQRVSELTAQGVDYYTAAMQSGREIRELLNTRPASTDASPDRSARKQVKRETVVRTPTGTAVPKKEAERIPTQSEQIAEMRRARGQRI